MKWFAAMAAVLMGFELPGYGAGTETLILSFDGKGTAMAWDAGVIAALFERLKTDKLKEILYVGSSSGSIASTYFACRGLTPKAVKDLPIEAQRFPKAVLNEGTTDRAIKLILDINPEIPFNDVKPIVDMAMNGGTCVPERPLLIAAANLDVVEGRNGKPFGGRRDRQFNRDNYELSQGAKVLGKVCTYFVSDSMAKILEVVPERERLCDLRHIRTADDLRLAIAASVAEPTYFSPPADNDLSKLVSVFAKPLKRIYGGGFVMNSAAQDVKRARPSAYVFGTGRASYSRLQNRILLNWFSFPMNETLMNQRWFFDEQVVITKAEWAVFYEKKTSNLDLIKMGYARAKKCLDAGGCKPVLFEKPLYSKDAWDQPLDDLRGRGLSALF